MFTKDTKTVGIIALCTLLVAVVLSVGLLYMIKKQRAELNMQAQVHTEARLVDQQLGALSKLVAETEAERTELAGYVVTEETVIEFLARIEDTARGAGVVLDTQSLSVNPIEGNEAFETLTLTVVVQGSYSAITHVLALFEALPYALTVDAVALERQGGPLGWRGSYTIRVIKHKAP